MPTKNDITGDQIKTKLPSENYRNNFDKIFGKKKKKVGKPRGERKQNVNN